MTTGEGQRRHRRALFQGILPLDTKRIPVEIVAGVTLAALAIPEVMGYTAIAGMPVVTGLYTILLPVLVFAVFGSSRHLVVGADSATAAVMAAGLAGLAATGSDQYVALAGLLALMAAAFLLLARVARLGFLADFLSRSVLVGFLTGVGIQVAAGQIGALFGVPEGSGVTIGGVDFDNTVAKFVSTLGNLGDVNWTTVAVSAAVIVVILGARFVTTKVPGALIAVIGAIFFSWWLDLADDGVSTIGPVSGGLPSIGLPDVAWSDVPSLLGTAASIFILILAQSAATSRAYAAKYNEEFDENVDLVGLGAASAAAGLSGTFVVNGSPTKTQMGDDAGARSQIAQLTVGAVVVIVLLFLTVPLQYLPNAVLAAVVLIIGIKLVDAANMRKILRERPGEFAVATLTAATVVFVGVEQGIVLAIVASIIEHLRHAYRPATAVMAPDADGDGFHSEPADPAARTAPGLVVYRFSSDLFYVNANHLMQDVTAFAGSPAPIEWFCLDASAITDVDFTGARTLEQVHEELTEHGITLVVAEAVHSVRDELDRYGLSEIIGADAFYPTVAAATAAFTARPAAHDRPEA